MKKKCVAALSLLLSFGVLASCDGTASNSSEVEEVTYKITAPAASTDYTITGLPEEAKAGARVRFTVKVNVSDKVVKEVKANDEVLTPSGSTGIYTFTMPEEDVTISVTLTGVSSITLDTSEAVTAFFLNDTFSYDGLKVTATYEDDSTATVERGFTVSTPDLTTAGEKEVTVTYGGVSATYTITVGDFEATGISMAKTDDDKVILTITGTYSGFASAAALTAAAKDKAGFDLQYNANLNAPSWDRFHDSDELTYEEGSEAGTFTYSVDITDLEGSSGSGYGYTVHFGRLLTSGDEAGNPADLKLSNYDPETSVTVGTKTYTFSLYMGWDALLGNTTIIVTDTKASSVTPTTLAIAYDETKDEVSLTLSGEYQYLSDDELSEANLPTTFYWAMMEFTTWVTITSNQSSSEESTVTAPTITVTPDTENTQIGTFSTTMYFAAHDSEGNPTLSASNNYFFHWRGTDNQNLSAASVTGLQTVSVQDKEGNTYTVKEATDYADSWKNGLVVLEFLGGDYVLPSSASLKLSDSKVLFSLTGTYSGYTDVGTGNDGDNTNDVYFLDCQGLTNTNELGSTPTVTLTPESTGATKGTFEVTYDVTGKLVEGDYYYFHFGILADGATYRSNLYLNTLETTSVEGTDGTYTLSVLSGYTNSDETWRNGLTAVSFTAKAA